MRPWLWFSGMTLVLVWVFWSDPGLGLGLLEALVLVLVAAFSLLLPGCEEPAVMPKASRCSGVHVLLLG